MRAGAGRWAWIACWAALSLPARAQPTDSPVRSGRMLVSSGMLIGSTRMVGLGGAYVGIAENASSMTANLAAIAHKKPTLKDPWNADLALSFLDIPLGNPQARDLDNDGAADDVRLMRQVVAGVALQVGSLGAGGYSRATYLRYCLTTQCGEEGDVGVTIATTAIAAALALGDDELLVALGLFSSTGDFEHAGAAWRYGAFALTFDALYRPVDRNFRIGLSVKPQIIGQLQGTPPPFGDIRPFAALATPFVFSVGGSVRLGPGAEGYNRLSVAKLTELGRVSEASLTPSSSLPGTLLLSAQVDVVAPVDDAVPVRAFLDPAAPQVIGKKTSLAPRLGVEHETLPGRLRTRLGTYLEPSPFDDKLHRFHATGGFELYLFRYLEDWAFSLSFDFAERYSDLGISIGLWR